MSSCIEQDGEKVVRRVRRSSGRSSSNPAPGRDKDHSGKAEFDNRRMDDLALPSRDSENLFSTKKSGMSPKKKTPLEMSTAEAHLFRRALEAKLPVTGNRGLEADLAQREFVEIRVDALFNGRLGVRLKMEGLVVTGFDVSEAADLGWRLKDEICAINRKGVRNKQEFSKELTAACRELPIIFTVARYSASSPNGGRSD